MSESCEHKTFIDSFQGREEVTMSAKHVSSKVAHSLKWLRLERITYVDQEGKERQWEMASRTTR